MKRLMLLMFLFPLGLIAQMTEQDKRLLDNVKRELSLTPVQLQKVDSLFNVKQVAIDSLDRRAKYLQQNTTDESTLPVQLSLISQKKKDVREMRELELKLMLTDEQRRIYDEKIKPKKPDVLHYGLKHDRANCNVCK